MKAVSQGVMKLSHLQTSAPTALPLARPPDRPPLVIRRI